MNYFRAIIIILFYTSIIKNSTANENSDFLSYLKTSEEFSFFYRLIKKAKYETLFKSETKYKKVLYIPNNSAFKNLPLRLQKYIWDDYDNTAAKKIIRTHLYSGSVKHVFKDPNKKVVIIDRFEVNGERVKIFSNSDLFVKDMVNLEEVIIKGNIQIIPVSCVMFLQQSFSDTRLSYVEKSKSLVTSCCILTENEVDNFIKDGNI